MNLPQTPSQTIGPFFHRALLREGMNDLGVAGAAGERITIEGCVLDGDNVPVTDALVEIWQANAAGRYDHPEDRQEKEIDPNFHGFGRAGTDEQGRFCFRTVKPGSVAGNGNVPQAPHISVSIFTRGLLKRLATRIYFPEEPLNASDPVLSAIRDTKRRATLVAHKMASAPEHVFRFDIVLQGDNETVFFDV